MGFDTSLASVIEQRPWRWTDGTQTAKQTLAGVFVLLSDALIDMLADNLTPAEKTELRQWVHRVTPAEAAEWHVPVWCGETSAVFLRVPAAVWNDPATPPPAKVRRYFARLMRESGA